jgi:hypothetical protein
MKNNNKENHESYGNFYSAEELKGQYPPQCQERAGFYLKRIDKLVENYKHGKTSIKIGSPEEKLKFIVKAQSLADCFLTDLQQFDQQTQVIKTHLDDLPEELKFKSFQAKKDRIYEVALKTTKNKDRENDEENGKRESLFSSLGGDIFKKSFLSESFGVPCRNDAQKLLEWEIINDDPLFVQNPFENLLRIYELGANTVKFETIQFKGQKIEALAIELLFKIDKETQSEKLWVSPGVNETLSTLSKFPSDKKP